MDTSNTIRKSTGREHRTKVNGQELFMWEKPRTAEPSLGTILFVHGSSMAATPGFDLQAPGTDYVSAMDWFAGKGFDTWTVDHRGYGRSYKGPEILATIAEGADDHGWFIGFAYNKKGEAVSAVCVMLENVPGGHASSEAARISGLIMKAAAGRGGD